MTNEVEIFFEDVPQQQNVLNVSTSVNESGESELIVGLSAYQIAVNRGFVGTVEEWLLSLKGDTGEQGISGIDGESAYQVALRNGFVGSEVEWLDSLQAQISAASGGSALPYISGRFYSQVERANTTNSNTLSSGADYFVPFVPHNNVTILQLGIPTNNNSTGRTLKVRVYSAAVIANQFNLTAITDVFEIAAATADINLQAITASLNSNQLYFVGFAFSAAAGVRAIPIAECLSLGGTNASVATNWQSTFLSSSRAYVDALPATETPTIFGTGNCPELRFLAG